MIPLDRPIATDADHAAALHEIEGLMDAEAGTPAFERLDRLSALVETYERQRWPID